MAWIRSCQREIARDPMTSDSDDGLYDLRGTVAVARTQALRRSPAG